MCSECPNICDAASVQAAGGEGCTSQVCHRFGVRGLLESPLHEHAGSIGLYQGADSYKHAFVHYHINYVTFAMNRWIIPPIYRAALTGIHEWDIFLLLKMYIFNNIMYIYVNDIITLFIYIYIYIHNYFEFKFNLINLITLLHLN